MRYFLIKLLVFIDDEELTEGVEAWSRMFEAHGAFNGFYKNRYMIDEHCPEWAISTGLSMR